MTKILCMVLVASWGAWAVQGAEVPELTVRISLSDLSFESKNAPPILVEVVPSKADLRMLDYRVRTDLRDNYARMTVRRQDGTDWDPLIAISDPGPVMNDAYVVVKQGENYAFEHNGYPRELRFLPPGVYFARLYLKPDWSGGGVNSNELTFRIEAP